MLNALLYKFRLKKRPDSDFNRRDVLKALPLRNQLITWEIDDKQEVSLVIPQKQKFWIRIASKLFMLPDKRVVVLDDVGSFVWQLCDGHNTVGHVVKQLCNRYQMTRKEAETSLFTYMRQLGKRGIIGFAVPKDMKGGKK